MKLNSMINRFNLILTWISRLAAVNFLWLLYTFAGLVVAGIFPATIASLDVTRKWIRGQRDIKLHHVFKEKYKKSFVSANLLGWILSLAGVVMLINYHLLKEGGGEVFFLAPFFFYLLVILYVVIVIWSFPLLTHYESNLKNYLKNSLILGMTKWPATLSIFVYLFAVTYHFMGVPVLLVFFYISVSSLGWMWLSLRTFDNLEFSKEEQVS
ncbi:YesL family protein [Halobacillus halophilus]|uniref:YesL family protein n=1 Tax=Halobacillus halophilus TaxID=1570 RepID=UPI001CD30057|nr:YesL family protein [Halobacillus halophilus]MCA1011437.1 YesL family protein [Halobacillus halophilus]